MERRTILAAILMAAVLMLYQVFFLPSGREAPPRDRRPSEEGEPLRTPAGGALSGSPQGNEILVVPRMATTSRPAERLVPVDTPLYHATVSSEGGKLQEYVLKYRGRKPMILVGELGPKGLVISPGPTEPGVIVPMFLSTDGLSLDAERPIGNLMLSGEQDSLRVREELKFGAGTYTIDARISIENRGTTSRTVVIALPWTAHSAPKDTGEKFTGQYPTEVVWSVDGDVRRENLTAVKKATFQGAWIAVASNFYLAALIPKSPEFKLAISSLGKSEPSKDAEKGSDDQVTVGVQANPTIAPGQAWHGQVLLYVGPKEYDKLRAYQLQGAINFGHFLYWGPPMEWLSAPIVLLMNWLYRFVRNYGVVIILLTVVSKILFYPLTVKSIQSMKAMQAIQPQVNALKSKYKNDPQRVQRETLDLYRKYGVNPMGGCLPMLAQIPIFYALYVALSVAVELQNAPFLCFGRVFGRDVWICDLAGYDPTYVLPILMGLSMFVQQKMTPMGPMSDPRQAKMMTIVMPAVFTFMFWTLPSGLVLYWFVSNVLQILQQCYMERSRSREANINSA